MSQNEEPKEGLQDASRREALAKLAKMTAYSTPAVVTLLTPKLSHAQASLPVNNGGCIGGGGNHIVVGADSATGADNNDSWIFGDAGFLNSIFNNTGSDCE